MFYLERRVTRCLSLEEKTPSLSYKYVYIIEVEISDEKTSTPFSLTHFVTNNSTLIP